MIEVICEPVEHISKDELNEIASRLSSIASLIELDEECRLGHITVALVTEDRICELHKMFFDDPTPTDVITFPENANIDDLHIDGEIAICVEVANEQASDAGHSVTDEIIFLAVHGLLHLCGWDDQLAESRAGMLARQQELIERAAREFGAIA